MMGKYDTFKYETKPPVGGGKSLNERVIEPFIPPIRLKQLIHSVTKNCCVFCLEMHFLFIERLYKTNIAFAVVLLFVKTALLPLWFFFNYIML